MIAGGYERRAPAAGPRGCLVDLRLVAPERASGASVSAARLRVSTLLHRVLRMLAVLAACATPAGNVLAWGEEGHRMVGAIADRHLTPEARSQVLALLKHDRLVDGQASQRRSLGEVAYWADEIKDAPWGRRKSAWHYDDIPVCGQADASQYCSNGGCASAQLSRHIDLLANRKEPLRRRNEALKWVVHLVGDIHQPLHAATRGDRGGNTVQVSFFGARDNPPYGTITLHAIWDVHMVRRLILDQGGEDAIVSRAPGAVQTADWEQGSIADWVEESHKLAVAAVYPMLPVELSCARGIEEVLTLDRVYYAKAAPVLESQIGKAGIRLARLLNQVFSR